MAKMRSGQAVTVQTPVGSQAVHALLVSWRALVTLSSISTAETALHSHEAEAGARKCCADQ
jgi:hypothetical protein